MSPISVAVLLLFNLVVVACGGPPAPPAHPPKIEAIRPTAEKTPPPAAPQPK